MNDSGLRDVSRQRLESQSVVAALMVAVIDLMLQLRIQYVRLGFADLGIECSWHEFADWRAEGLGLGAAGNFKAEAWQGKKVVSVVGVGLVVGQAAFKVAGERRERSPFIAPAQFHSSFYAHHFLDSSKIFFR